MGNGAIFKVPVNEKKKKKKKKKMRINNSWTESFNFQTSFNCH